MDTLRERGAGQSHHDEKTGSDWPCYQMPPFPLLQTEKIKPSSG
jgi:hypothetical protein